MVLIEAGIMVRGYPLVYSSYHHTGGKKIDIVLRSGLLTGIISFVESAYSKEMIEYIESKNYIIAFKADKIKDKQMSQPELLVAYVIIEKIRKFDKFISKNIIPFLSRVLKKFIERYSGENLSYVSLFEDFKKELDKVFEIESKSLDNKFKNLF